MIKYILKILTPLIWLIGKINLPFKISNFSENELAELKSVLEPGDIILTTTWGAFSNLINWGTWKHATMCTEKYLVAEFVDPKGQEVSLEHVVMGKYRVIALRSKKHSKKDISQAVANMRSRLHHKYDYLISLDKNKDYCSEGVYHSYIEANPSIQLKHDVVLGVPVVRPNHFREDKETWEIVYRR